MRFERLEVLSRLPKEGARMFSFKCRCECGNEKNVRIDHLRSGRTKSCGCLNREQTSARNFKHGLRRHPLYTTWDCIRQRCTNPNNPNYKNYGGRGIRLCERWTTFANFIEDVGPRPPGRTLDRSDNERGYEPGNVRWATKHVQTRNSRRNRLLTFEGKTRCLSDWATEKGIDRQTLSLRLDRLGWSVEKALTTKRPRRADFGTRRSRSSGPSIDP